MPVCPRHAPFHQLGSELSRTWIKSPRWKPSSPSSWGSKSNRAWTYVGCWKGNEKHTHSENHPWHSRHLLLQAGDVLQQINNKHLGCSLSLQASSQQLQQGSTTAKDRLQNTSEKGQVSVKELKYSRWFWCFSTIFHSLWLTGNLCSTAIQ